MRPYGSWFNITPTVVEQPLEVSEWKKIIIKSVPYKDHSGCCVENKLKRTRLQAEGQTRYVTWSEAVMKGQQ
jgi:hypothetical protein